MGVRGAAPLWQDDRTIVQRFLGPLFSSPLIRRVGWHLSRVRGAVDRRFFIQLLGGAFVLVLIAATIITLVEKPWTLGSLGASMNWGVQTILGQGDSSFVTTPVGWVVGWFFSMFGIAIIGTLTGALVALVIDFLLKEGQGLGASGYQDHIVVCGWNQTARDLIDELRGDEYRAKVVVLAEGDKNPAGEGVYFVNGDSTDTAALERAGIREAKAALIFPTVASNEADMHSILTIMAIESMAPEVRTVAEVNNPRPRRALPADPGRRDPRDVAPRLPAPGPLRPVSRPDRAGHRHRVGRRRLRAVPRDAPG